MQSTGHVLCPLKDHMCLGQKIQNMYKFKNPIAKNNNFMKQKDKTALCGVYLMLTHMEIQHHII